MKHLPELSSRDFSNYKNHGLGKTPNFSGVDVFVDTKSRKIASIYIIDKVANETDYVSYRLYKDFLCCYVDNFVARPTQFLDEMFEEHADWLHSGRSKSTLAEAVFNIAPKKRGARASLVAKLDSLKVLLPAPSLPSPKRKEPGEASVQPSLAEPPVTNEGPKRRSSGPNDLVEGLLAMPTDHEITRETLHMIKVAKEMMDHSDDGCIMMMFVEEIPWLLRRCSFGNGSNPGLGKFKLA
jgi:hypothetical protein